jgi:hypothetical protein
MNNELYKSLATITLCLPQPVPLNRVKNKMFHAVFIGVAALPLS